MAEKNRFVPQGELSAYERWELPNIGTASTGSRSFSSTKKVKPLTAEDIEAIRQQAYAAGLEEGRTEGKLKGHEEGLVSGSEKGHQEGVQQGLIDGQAQIDEQTEKLKALLLKLGDPLSQQVDQVEQAILNVVMAVTRAVIHRELSVDSSSISVALSQILENLPKADMGVILTVHPENQDTIKELLDSLASNIELKTESTITPGGCILETSNQLIDYTIEKRFQKVVYKTLLGAVGQERDSSVIETPATIDSMSDFPADTLNEADLELIEPENPSGSENDLSENDLSDKESQEDDS